MSNISEAVKELEDTNRRLESSKDTLIRVMLSINSIAEAHELNPTQRCGQIAKLSADAIAQYRNKLHPPIMKMWDIYAEGHQATGESGVAGFMGRGQGITFREACIDFAKKDAEFNKYFNLRSLSHWGCKLFPTLEEAKRSFG